MPEATRNADIHNGITHKNKITSICFPASNSNNSILRWDHMDVDMDVEDKEVTCRTRGALSSINKPLSSLSQLLLHIPFIPPHCIFQNVIQQTCLLFFCFAANSTFISIKQNYNFLKLLQRAVIACQGLCPERHQLQSPVQFRTQQAAAAASAALAFCNFVFQVVYWA